MSLPPDKIEIVFLTVLLMALLAGGVLAGWLVARHRHASHSREEFLQLMRHAEFVMTNCLMSIRGHLALFGEELPTDHKRWQVSRGAIGEATDQMLRGIQRLGLIRMGLEGSTLRVEPVDLARLIEQILIALEPAATEKQISIRKDVHLLAQLVHGDPQMLAEIFTTLLENAIKHNPPGTSVVVELSRQNDMALSRISDTGQGISLELHPQNFPGGPGLKLARLLTELHGGTISVESERDHGSAFSVALPFSGPRNKDVKVLLRLTRKRQNIRCY